MKALKSNRLHIGFFGKRNAGKSTLVNKIIGQELSIVSDTKGTTTDVNQKAMELLPIGPVMLLDTAGIDDIGELGKLRIEKSMKALLRCDVVVFVVDNSPIGKIEKEFIEKIKNNNSIIITVQNKTDLGEINKEDKEFLEKNSHAYLKTSGITKDNFIFEFKKALIKNLPEEYINPGVILKDIIKENEVCIFVIPIDKEAPKGRIILPQVNSIREMLDNNSITLVCNENNLDCALHKLKAPPKIVVVDSQAFKKVSSIVPDDIMLTSFSILFARLKGDIKSFYEGAKKLDNLNDNDKILVLESCSHHPVEDDIGRVKIPDLIRKYTNKNLIFEHFSGHDFPLDIERYSLIIHCGACMTTRGEVMRRILISKEKNIPITNYGIVIAKCTGILERAMKPVFNKD